MMTPMTTAFSRLSKIGIGIGGKKEKNGNGGKDGNNQQANPVTNSRQGRRTSLSSSILVFLTIELTSVLGSDPFALDNSLCFCRSKEQMAANGTTSSTPKSTDNSRGDCNTERGVLKGDPGIAANPIPGIPCRTQPIDSRLKCNVQEHDSINTFLRPDNLLMTDVSIKMDQTKPYLVGNKLMRQIPLRDPSKQLSDKELRCLHWVVGESVERHGTVR